MARTAAFRKVEKARTVLVVSNGFFGCLALQLDLVEVNNPMQVDTMAVDGKRLYFNPGFIDKLSEEELVGVNAHEVYHCALNHMTRRGHRDPTKWNVACDFAINADLIKVPFKLPGEPVGIKDRGTGKKGYLYDPQFENMSAEEIYEKLPDDLFQNSSGGKRTLDPGGCGRVMDAGNNPEDKESAQQIAHEWEANVRMAIAVAKGQNAGKTPGYLERLVNQLQRPKVNWRDLTRQFIDQSMTRDFSYRRPNRRYTGSAITLPGLVPDALHEMVMVADTSGSINDAMLNAFLSEVAGALDDGTTDKLIVLYADTEVRHVDEFYPGDIVTCRTAGGGGTDFDDSFRWIKENTPETACIVYLTDMETCSFGEDLGIPTLWCAYSTQQRLEQIQPPFGQTILVESPE